MVIDDAIQTLTKIYRSIDQGIPKTAASPDALINHLNDLYGEFYEGLTSEELFAYDDVRSPSITLTIGIDVEFDLIDVMILCVTMMQDFYEYHIDIAINEGI
jgi:hypothetical protein